MWSDLGEIVYLQRTLLLHRHAATLPIAAREKTSSPLMQRLDIYFRFQGQLGPIVTARFRSGKVDQVANSLKRWRGSLDMKAS